ncbi:MAG: hypothetical protein MJ074_08420 [Oscillospiraceae bacterium]|nr:hypothetical protein [Oscillospiraceae bacterium]
MAKETESNALDLAALREQLKAEILADIRKDEEKKQSAISEEELKAKKYLEEYVEVQLFKDGKDYKDDVFVAVNGENCQIKRGVPVKIKRKFALVLEASQRQDIVASEYAEAQQNEFSAQARRFNM